MSFGVRGIHMNASKKSAFCRVAALTAVIAVLLVCQASAGGPVCATPRCLPPMCGPQPCCPPPMCAPAPVCPPPMCAPAPCAPPMCGPRMCGPKPCAPQCEDNPLCMIVKGTFRLVAGAVALPFKLVGCLLQGPCATPTCCPPRPACPPIAMCPPPSCMPSCAPPACGMGYCPPGMGYGMGPMAPPMGFGRGVPRPMMKPMAKKGSKSLPPQLLAGPSQGLFGAYW